MADRDGIVVEFQNFTGIDDVDQCVTILEQHDWNLQEAVQTVLAGDDSPQHEPIGGGGGGGRGGTSGGGGRSDNPVVHSTHRNQFLVAGTSLQQNHNSSSSGASGFSDFPAQYITDDDDAITRFPEFGEISSSPQRRLLIFDIEYRDKVFQITIHDNETVAKLKQLIRNETSVPEDKQELHNWPQKNDIFIKDTDTLQKLTLPKNIRLCMLTPDLPLPSQPSPEKLAADVLASRQYELQIQDLSSNKPYTLKYPGTKTIKGVKDDVFTLINVYVRNQVWTGWPPSYRDTMTLIESGIDYPTHHLTVCSRESRAPVSITSSLSDASSSTNEASTSSYNPFSLLKHSTTSAGDEVMEIDSENDDDDHYEDILETEELVGRLDTHKPLMPQNASDQLVAVEHFYQEFQRRYGEPHPIFYIGTLEDAIKEALQCKARERKLLAIYLHHDHSIQANVFCSQILCTEMIVSYLSNNFVSWAWDLTHESNQAMLLTLCTTHFGSVAANTVKTFDPDQLPLVLIIARNRGINEVVQVIQGNTSLDEFLTCLIQAVEVSMPQKMLDIQEERERDERESMLAEQDAAYRESLAVDRAKEESRKRQEEEERLRDVEDRKRQSDDELRQKEEAEEREAICKSLANRLPEEPPADCTEPMTTIRIKCPDGTARCRRFISQNPLCVLLDYITSQGFLVDQHKVLTTYPRRDLAQLDASLTLLEHKLHPQETLILEPH